MSKHQQMFTTEAKSLNTIFNGFHFFHVFVDLIRFKLNPQFLKLQHHHVYYAYSIFKPPCLFWKVACWQCPSTLALHSIDVWLHPLCIQTYLDVLALAQNVLSSVFSRSAPASCTVTTAALRLIQVLHCLLHLL